ncbi:MAG: hypothetical protein ACKOE4_03170 [Candidatus Kapaibacterium sp.]
MIRRILQWMGLDHVLLNPDSDEIVRSIRHRSAHTTMQLTVVGCLVTVAVIQFWFPDLEQVTITLAIVTLFIMITSGSINGFHGVGIAEEQLLDRRPINSSSTKRAFLSLFVILYVCISLTYFLMHGAAPQIFDLIGIGVKSLIWTGITLYVRTRKNKRATRSS